MIYDTSDQPKSRPHARVEPSRAEVRAAISNAYYDARNAGDTMETAADNAADSVLEIFGCSPQVVSSGVRA